MALYQGSSHTLEGDVSFSASWHGQTQKDGPSHAWQRGGRKSQPQTGCLHMPKEGNIWGNLCNLMIRPLSPPPTPKHVSLWELWDDLGTEEVIYQGKHMSTPAHIWEYLQLCWDKQRKLGLSQAKQNTRSPNPNPKEGGFVSCHPTEGRFQVERKLRSENKVSELQVDRLLKSFTFRSWCPRRSICWEEEKSHQGKSQICQ